MVESEAIQALRGKVKELETALHQAERELEDVLIAAAPFKVGDVVSVTRRHENRRAIVREVTAKYEDVEYQVSFEKKDGTWSLRTERTWLDTKIAWLDNAS